MTRLVSYPIARVHYYENKPWALRMELREPREQPSDPNSLIAMDHEFAIWKRLDERPETIQATWMAECPDGGIITMTRQDLPDGAPSVMKSGIFGVFSQAFQQRQQEGFCYGSNTSINTVTNAVRKSGHEPTCWTGDSTSFEVLVLPMEVAEVLDEPYSRIRRLDHRLGNWRALDFDGNFLMEVSDEGARQILELTQRIRKARA